MYLSACSSIKSGTGKLPFGVDIWAGQAHGHADKSTKGMSLVVAAVFMTIWWQLS